MNSIYLRQALWAICVANITIFGYDPVDRETAMVDMTNGGAHTETYAYDAVGNLTSLTDRDGRVQRFSYDALDRLTLSTWLNASGTTVNVLTYMYDYVGNLTMAANLNGAYTMTYDAANQATVVQEPFGQTLTFTYDGAGNRATMVDSQAGLTSYVYDANNNLMAVLAGYGGAGEGGSPATLAVTFAYTPTNQVSEIRRYIDVSGISDVSDVESLRAGTWTGGSTAIANTSYTYDAAERVTNIVHRSGQTSTFTNLAYSYDAGDRVTQLVQDGVTTTYGYDAANQLLSDGTSTFTYDHNGNRNMTGYVTAAGNEVTNDGTWTYSYDNEGNVVGKSNSTYSWGFSYDNQNHLTEAKEYVLSTDLIQVDETYKYDAFGNRIETDVTTGGTTTVTRFAYDGWKVKQGAVGNRPTFVGNENWDVWAQLDGSNTLQVRYVYGTGVDQLLGRDDSDVAFYLTDRLGSVRVVVDNLGNFQDLLYYNGFGGLVTETNASFSDQYKYVSREIDAYSGLIYHRARWYDPGTGRFMSQDPMGFLAGDANLYRYVGNSPTNATDPSGKTVFVNQTDYGWMRKLLDDAGLTADLGFQLVRTGRGDFMLVVPDANIVAQLVANAINAQRNADAEVSILDILTFSPNQETHVIRGRFNEASITHQPLKYKKWRRDTDLIDKLSNLEEDILGGVQEVVANPRVGGLLQIIGGAAECALGAVPGCQFLIVLGIDNIAAGGNTLITGEPTDTMLNQLLRQANETVLDPGPAKTAANIEELLINLVACGYAGMRGGAGAGANAAEEAGAGAAPNLDAMSQSAGKLTGPGSSFTEAGSSLQSHSGRPGWPGPTPSGNAANVNAQAQNLVDEVLTNPNSSCLTRPHPRPDWGGSVTDVYRPDGLGVRFDANGNFVGFITRRPN